MCGVPTLDFVISYVRAYRAGRDPRRSYHELAGDGTPLRHIEMRAADGTYLAAVSAGAPAAPPGAEPMTAADFEEIWRLARCQLDGVVQIQIHEVRRQAPDGVPVVIRCLGGQLRRGSSFTDGDGTDLTVVRMLLFDREVPVVTPLHSALITLSGTGRVRAGQVLQGRS